jgi:hypothetical protein
MKKKFFKIWLVYFLTGVVLFAAMKYLFCITLGKEIDFTEAIFLSVINSLLITSLLTYGHFYFFPRNKYLDTNNGAKPSFKIVGSSIIDVPQGLDFRSLKNVIAGRWMVTFSDDWEKVLKFTNRMGILQSWGVSGAWLKFDDDAGKIHLECFPLAGIQENKKALKMQNEIIELLQHL